MIKKILFTAIVAAAVFLFYKIKRQQPEEKVDTTDTTHAAGGKLSTQLIAYIVVGFMLLFSAIFFTLNWLDDNSIIQVRVVVDNTTTEYQVKKNTLKDRTFTTVDGRIIELGENERLEVLPQ